MGTRLFTIDEQRRLNERAEAMSRAFMWYENRSDRFARVLHKSVAYGAILLCAACMACWAAVEISAQLKATGGIAAVIGICVTWIMAEARIFAYVLVKESEAMKASPPVFVFFGDKLYMLSGKNGFDGDTIPKIPAGEISALRREVGHIAASMSNKSIEAECFYLSAIEQYELGNESSLLDIVVIDDIVDVYEENNGEALTESSGRKQNGSSDDSGAGSFFVIEYEQYGEPAQIRLSLSKWRDLYQWLFAQLRGA